MTAYYQAAQNVPIVVTETPTGSGTLGVDGNQITASQTFYWTTGSTHQLSAQNGNGQFGGATGIAIDPSSGNVYVVDYPHHRVEEFTSTGTYVTQWGSVGSGNGQFTYPYGIAVDSSGRIYVTELGNYRVEVFTNSGTYLTQFGSEGVGNGQFVNPTGVAIDSSGDVYVVDNVNNRVEVFHP